MTKIDYMDMCELVNKHDKILPPYSRVAKEKANCRPPKDQIFGSDHDVQVPLQEILNITVKRILQDDLVAARVRDLSEKNGGELDLKFLYKWGVDGSKGHPIWKQVCECCRDPGALLASHMVGLQMVAVVNGKMEVIYDNVLCNSPLACRPLRLWWVNETNEHVAEEIGRIRQEQANLQPFEWEQGITVRFAGESEIIKYI